MERFGAAKAARLGTWEAVGAASPGTSVGFFFFPLASIDESTEKQRICFEAHFKVQAWDVPSLGKCCPCLICHAFWTWNFGLILYKLSSTDKCLFFNFMI